MYRRNRVEEIRQEFIRLRQEESYVVDKTGVRLLEIQGASFVADDVTIFGRVNHSYVARELQWYESMSLNVNDIPGGAPAVWKDVATPQGFINSNYGFLIYSIDNCRQYECVKAELQRSPTSRRAIMIYTRPSMHVDWNRNGKSDFICTNAVQYLIRDGELDAVVQMRSNDVHYGYRNDRAFQRYVQVRLADDIGVETGYIHWQVGSLHLYERDFWRVDCYDKFGLHLTERGYAEALNASTDSRYQPEQQRRTEEHDLTSVTWVAPDSWY